MRPLARAAAISVLGFVSTAAALGGPGESAAGDAFARYIAARNRHDLAAIRALTGPDIRAFDEQGKPHPWNETRLRGVLAWEARMHAKWKGRALGFSGGWLEAEASEENDLYDALAIGVAIARHRLRVVGGRIVEWRSMGGRSTGRDEAAAIGAFERWIRDLPSGARAGALDDRGRIVLTPESADVHLVLIRRWKEERATRR